MSEITEMWSLEKSFLWSKKALYDHRFGPERWQTRFSYKNQYLKNLIGAPFFPKIGFF